MAGAGTAAAKGAVAGAAVGSAVPVVGNIVGAVGGAVVGFVSSLFGSKKHYHLYYWDPQESSWKFVLDGHPSQVNPQASAYQKSGLVTAVIRNVGDKNPDGSLAPKSPPAGYEPSTASTSSKTPWVVAGIAGALVLGVVLLRKGRRG